MDRSLEARSYKRIVSYLCDALPGRTTSCEPSLARLDEQTRPSLEPLQSLQSSVIRLAHTSLRSFSTDPPTGPLQIALTKSRADLPFNILMSFGTLPVIAVTPGMPLNRG